MQLALPPAHSASLSFTMTVKDTTTRLLMLLLLLAATLLASLAKQRLPPPLHPAGGHLHLHHNLNSVLDLAFRINRALAAVSTTSSFLSFLPLLVFLMFQGASLLVWLKETFVEDVSHLAEGPDKCEVRRTWLGSEAMTTIGFLLGWIKMVMMVKRNG